MRNFFAFCKRIFFPYQIFLPLVLAFSGLADMNQGRLTYAVLGNAIEMDFSELTGDSVYFEMAEFPVEEADFIFGYTFDSVFAPHGMVEVAPPDSGTDLTTAIENGEIRELGEEYQTLLPISANLANGTSYKIRTAEGDTAYLFFESMYIGGIDRYSYRWAYQFQPGTPVMFLQDPKTGPAFQGLGGINKFYRPDGRTATSGTPAHLVLFKGSGAIPFTGK